MDAELWKIIGTVVTFFLGVGSIKWYNTYQTNHRKNRELLRKENREDLNRIIDWQRGKIEQLERENKELLLKQKQ